MDKREELLFACQSLAVVPGQFTYMSFPNLQGLVACGAICPRRTQSCLRLGHPKCLQQEGGAPVCTASPASGPRAPFPPLPALTGRTSLGAHMTALQSTGRATLLSGRVSSATLCCLAGTGSCSGLQFRMQKEISALVSPTINVKVWPSQPTLWGLPKFAP